MKKISLVALAATFASAGFAQSLSNTTFESPTYTLGGLQGQNGWFGFGSNTGANVSNQNPFGGSQNFQVDMSTAKDAGWLWQDTPVPSTSTQKLISIKGKFRINELTGTPTGTSQLGIDCYSAAVDGLSTIRFFPSYDNGGTNVPGAFGFFSDSDGLGYFGFIWGTGIYNFNEWVDTELILDFNTLETRFKINGAVGPSLPLNPAVTDLNDADLLTSSGGGLVTNPFVACVDNYWISKSVGTNISGSVNCEAWPTGSSAPNMSDFYVNLAIYDSPTNLVDSITTLPDFDGGINVNSTLPPGTYDILVTSGLCLSKRLVNVSLPGPIVVTLDTGDTDASNSVDISDYLNLSAAFDSFLDEDPGTAGNQSSANWNFNCDFDASGSVDIGDYLLLAANFDKTGDV